MRVHICVNPEVKYVDILPKDITTMSLSISIITMVITAVDMSIFAQSSVPYLYKVAAAF
jgi:hypothetical protein